MLKAAMPMITDDNIRKGAIALIGYVAEQEKKYGGRIVLTAEMVERKGVGADVSVSFYKRSEDHTKVEPLKTFFLSDLKAEHIKPLLNGIK